jgi:hypothetical protein
MRLPRSKRGSSFKDSDEKGAQNGGDQQQQQITYMLVKF